jgi:hypothetical protein
VRGGLRIDTVNAAFERLASARAGFAANGAGARRWQSIARYVVSNLADYHGLKIDLPVGGTDVEKSA